MNRKLNIAIPAMLFLFITVLLPALPGFQFDTHEGWETWARYIHTNGLRNAYGSNTNYMPVYQYILWAYAKLMGTDKAIADNLPYLRCITLAFDFAGIWYVHKWIDKKLAYSALLAICILNISYTYNTLIWGQIDGILAAMIFLSLYYAWKGKNLASAIWIIFAFNLKIQTLVILPVWGLLFINNYRKGRIFDDILWPIVVAGVLQVALFFPFTRGQYSIGKIYHIIVHSFSSYQSISIKAPNLWHWVVKGNLLYSDDSKIWVLGLSYKTAGLILFFVTALLALLPMIKLVRKNLKSAIKIPVSRELIWAMGAMVYMLFYYFNTEIHERYCHPAFIFITAYAFFTGNFIVYVLFSIMYFLTLEVSMQHLKLTIYDSFIFDFRFLAAINLLIIICLARSIRKHYKLSEAISIEARKS
jgi:Gpi18-like mannosyltransferase